jgi:2-aminoethylphosphonate-pyruvate transaminase
MRNKDFKMFTCGPVSIDENVKNALIYPTIGHRESEFTNLYKRIREKLLKVFGVGLKEDEYGCVVIGGSGSSAMETVVCSVLHEDKKLLAVANGEFGQRFADISEIYNIRVKRVFTNWGDYPDLNIIEKELQTDTNIEAVSMVAMETSTGMLNPIHETGKLCKKYKKLFIVDTVVSQCGEKMNVVGDNIDYCITNTNKGLCGAPVLGIICYKKSALDTSKDVKPRSFTLDLFKHIEYAEKKGQSPFTPQIPLFFMLDEALNKTLEEGIANRIDRYARNGRLLKRRLLDMGFRFHLKNETWMSNLMVNVLIPDNYRYEDIHDFLKKKGYVIYPGKGMLKDNIMHIANMGTLEEKEINQFCDDLEEIIKVNKIEYIE